LKRSKQFSCSKNELLLNRLSILQVFFSFMQLFMYYLFDTFSALTRFGIRKSTWPVSDEVFCGCLSGMKCRLFVYGPADTTAFPKTPSSLPSFKSCLSDGLPFWYRITQVVHEKRPLNGCSSSYIIYFIPQGDNNMHICVRQ